MGGRYARRRPRTLGGIRRACRPRACTARSRARQNARDDLGRRHRTLCPGGARLRHGTHRRAQSRLAQHGALPVPHERRRLAIAYLERAAAHRAGPARRSDVLLTGDRPTRPAMPDLFPLSTRALELRGRLIRFQRERVEPAEAEYFAHVDVPAQRWTIPPVIERLKREARAAGLWNLFLPDAARGAGLSNLEYAPLAEAMGRSPVAPEVYNCN